MHGQIANHVRVERVIGELELPRRLRGELSTASSHCFNLQKSEFIQKLSSTITRRVKAALVAGVSLCRYRTRRQHKESRRLGRRSSLRRPAASCATVQSQARTADKLTSCTLTGPMRVVISLTTIPERRPLLEKTLDSIARQSRQPEAVYLWLPDERFRGKGLNYRFPGVEVRTGADLGPAMKLLPVLMLECEPDTRIITIDDDVEYPPELVERLANASAMQPSHAIGFTGWCVEEGPIGHQVHHFNEDVIAAKMHQIVHVLEGYRGVIYQRGFFESDIFEHLRSLDAFWFHDDILFSGYLASRGVPRVSCWYGASSSVPGESHWNLQGDQTGLHTGSDWFNKGVSCLDYWQRQFPAIWKPVCGSSKGERLQLNSEACARHGFTHHATLSGSASADVVHDLRKRPWIWSDSTFSEILVLERLPGSIAELSIWLQECYRILRPARHTENPLSARCR